MSDGDAEGGSGRAPAVTGTRDPSEAARQIQRLVFRALPTVLRAGQALRELGRRVRGAPHVIDYFHRVDDPYAQLAVEAIPELLERYDVELRCHLVGPTERLHAPEPELLARHARRDCALVAPHYGLAFPSDADAPSEPRVARVHGLLAGLGDDPRFVELATLAGRALWRADDVALDAVCARGRSEDARTVRDALEAGNALRAKHRHYSGAMFWYAGEWYWGVDRLHHLERRLIRLGAHRAGSPDARPRFDRPPLDPGPVRDDGRLRLEIYPSLRSPYTALIFDRSLALARQAAVAVDVRPVMPMVMRGVPVPPDKGLYIILDSLREAAHLGVPFGDMRDPVGRPVERGFSLWPWARDQGRGAEYVSAFLRAAFAEGRPTGTDAGLRRVVQEAGLDFDEARGHLDGDAWRAELEANRRVMYEELGLWGVPSYRLRGPAGEPDLCVWGQDRLWLVAAEIRRRLALPAA